MAERLAYDPNWEDQVVEDSRSVDVTEGKAGG